MLLDDYRARVDQLFAEVRETQTENIIAAGKLVADAVAAGCNIYLSNICHYMEYDLLERGGGPTFYKPFRYALELKNYTTHYQARRRTDLLSGRPISARVTSFSSAAFRGRRPASWTSPTKQKKTASRSSLSPA